MQPGCHVVTKSKQRGGSVLSIPGTSGREWCPSAQFCTVSLIDSAQRHGALQTFRLSSNVNSADCTSPRFYEPFVWPCLDRRGKQESPFGRAFFALKGGDTLFEAWYGNILLCLLWSVHPCFYVFWSAGVRILAYIRPGCGCVMSPTSCASVPSPETQAAGVCDALVCQVCSGQQDRTRYNGSGPAIPQFRHCRSETHQLVDIIRSIGLRCERRAEETRLHRVSQRHPSYQQGAMEDCHAGGVAGVRADRGVTRRTTG